MKDNCDKELVRVVNHCIADTLKRQDIVFDVEILLQGKLLLMCEAEAIHENWMSSLAKERHWVGTEMVDMFEATKHPHYTHINTHKCSLTTLASSLHEFPSRMSQW